MVTEEQVIKGVVASVTLTVNRVERDNPTTIKIDLIRTIDLGLRQAVGMTNLNLRQAVGMTNMNHPMLDRWSLVIQEDDMPSVVAQLTSSNGLWLSSLSDRELAWTLLAAFDVSMGGRS